jgi:hypothetical protein
MNFANIIELAAVYINSSEIMVLTETCEWCENNGTDCSIFTQF